MATNGVKEETMESSPEAEPTAMDTSDCLTEEYRSLDDKVVERLEDIFKSGKLTYSDLDSRTLDTLKELPVEGALEVLRQFVESNLEHVSNKSAYLCGVMKTYWQKTKPLNSTKGPDEEKIEAILKRTGYTLDVTSGQRKYGGPPPNWGDRGVPGSGCEVFVGKIPKDMYEDELIPLFEQCGQIWDLRLMMDPTSGQNRGYAFVTFTNKDDAQRAVKQLDNYEIRKGKELKVNVSVPNLRLFVGNIPKSKSKEEILEEFTKLTAGLVDVIIYSSPDDKKKNRGFCFLEYECHKSASLAKRRLGTGRVKVWACDIIVDWADPQEEPDEETMAKVKVLYARNLTSDMNEDKLKEMFGKFGTVERVKKIKDYAFIHFEARQSAVKAIEGLDKKDVGGGTVISVSLAKPPSDKKKKEEMLRNRERRMMQSMQSRAVLMGMPSIGRSGGRGSRMDPRSYEYNYDYYGYGDYQGGYADPYFEDFYCNTYEDYYSYGSPPRGATGRGQRGRSLQDRGHSSTQARGRPRGWGSRSSSRVRGTVPSWAQRGNLTGKRKFDGGHQNQGDSKRRFQNKGSWGGQPLLYRGGGEDTWYQDSYGTQWA